MLFREPPKTGPVLVRKNSSPDRTRTTYAIRNIYVDLCSELEKLEGQGWEVHTVDRRHSAPHGDFYWVLLRKPGVSKSGGRNA